MLQLPSREVPEPAGRPVEAALPGLRLSTRNLAGGWPAPLAAGALSGLALAAAFPPTDWGGLAFVALVPLALVFRQARPRQVAAAAGVFGVTFFGLLLPWLHLFGMAAYVLLGGLQAAFLVAALTLGVLVRNRLPSPMRFLAFPLALLSGEFLRSNGPIGGFPWGALGYSQHNDAAVLHVAAYAGVWGVSFLVALANAVAAEAVAAIRTAPKSARLRLGVAAALVAGAGLLPVATPHGSQATVALVQGNAPLQDPAHRHALDQQALDNQVAVTGGLHGRPVSLVVWPESSLGHNPFTDQALLAPLLATVRQVGAPFLVGATVDAPPLHGTPRFRNENLFFSADGALSATYVKMHLVPFGEYVPGRRLLAGWIKELNRVPADGIPGTSPTAFPLPQGTFGSVICYETAYPELVSSVVAKGARMIVVSTDNSSYRRTPTSAQMVAMSQLRAAEQRMWVTQAALTGISAVIAPDGHVTQRTGLFQPALLIPTVTFATGLTMYARYGDWLPFGVLIISALLLVAAIATRNSVPA